MLIQGNSLKRAQARLWAMLLCVFLFVRAFAPSGFMPVMSTQGITIALCTGHGEATVHLDLKGEKQAPEKAQHDCPFSFGATAPAAPVANTFAVVGLILGDVAPLTAAIAHLITPRLAAPPPPSQAPPHIL